MPDVVSSLHLTTKKCCSIVNDILTECLLKPFLFCAIFTVKKVSITPLCWLIAQFKLVVVFETYHLSQGKF